MDGMLFDLEEEHESKYKTKESGGVETEGRLDGMQLAEESLSEKEWQALEAYRHYGSIAKAARAMGIRVDTAEKRMYDIRTKLGVSDSRMLLKTQRGRPCEATSISASWLLALIESQQYRCALSGRLLTPETASLDHKSPVSADGEHERDNVWWVHSEVNAAKGTMNTAEFIKMCQDVAKHTFQHRTTEATTTAMGGGLLGPSD